MVERSIVLLNPFDTDTLENSEGAYADSEFFVGEGQNLTCFCFFKLMRGEMIQIPL